MFEMIPQGLGEVSMGQKLQGQAFLRSGCHENQRICNDFINWFSKKCKMRVLGIEQSHIKF